MCAAAPCCLCSYDSLGAGIATLYEDAKVEHKKGIELLMRAFNYHPLFKIEEDGFTATPFKPK